MTVAVPTGFASLDDLLGGGLPRGASVILQGPSGEEKEALAWRFLKAGWDAGEAAVVVLSSISPQKFRDRLAAVGVVATSLEDSRRLVIVDWFSHREESVADIADERSVLKVNHDLANVGVAISWALNRLGEAKGVRAVLEVLSPALNTYELKDVSPFAQVTKAKLERRGVTSLFLVEREMHDPATLSNLQQPFDGVIDIERARKGDRIVRKIGVPAMRGSPLAATRYVPFEPEGASSVAVCPSCGTQVEGSPRMCYNCGADLRRAGEHPTAALLQLAEERLARDPKDLDALFAKGAALARMERWDESIGALNEVTKTEPAYPGVWLLKAEVYSRLGKPKMAQKCRERGLELSGKENPTQVDVGMEPKPSPGSATESRDPHVTLPERAPADVARDRDDASRRGLTNGFGPQGGSQDRARTRGRTNGGRGRTNGLVNGRGRTNGIVDGQGRTNGLVNGRGRTNGLVNGVSVARASLRDGLTNGAGFTNGLGGTRFSREARRQRWKLYLIPLATIALLMVPLLGPQGPGTVYPIVIDGVFGDWAASRLIDAARNPQLNPSVDIVRFGIADNLDSLAFYAEVAGTALQGGGSAPGTMDAVRFFVDADGSPATGYEIDGLGADHMVEVFGIGGLVRTSTMRDFDSGRDPRDWNGWIQTSSVPAAAGGSRVEVAAGWSAFAVAPARLAVAVRSQSWDGQADSGDVLAGLDRGTLLIAQESVSPSVLSGSDVRLLNFTATAVRQAVSWESLSIRLLGTAPPTTATSIRIVDSTGSAVSAQVPSSRDVSFGFSPIALAPGTTATYSVVADIVGTGGETFGARIPGPEAIGSSNGVASLREVPGARSVGYVGIVPGTPSVDGGFAEWANASMDPANDGGPRGHPEIDLRGHGALTGGASLHLYADVEGKLFAGTFAPEALPLNFVAGSGAPDSDRDTVPDSIDSFPFDFDNDNVPDAETGGDYDGDGVTDFGSTGGTDLWLNTTIPASFPPPYGGRPVSVYIGPTNRPVVLGDDVLRFLLDTDGNTSTGYATAGIGADWMVEVRGKAGTVIESAISEFVGAFPGDWRWNPASPVTVATGYRAVELAVSFPSAAVFVEIGDFWGSADTTASGPALVSGGLPGPYDIPGNEVYRLRNTNHATETACTVNKVASTTAGAGPAQLATLNAGQNACWYLDATSGSSIAAGDWESLLDISRTTALAVDAVSSTSGDTNPITWSHTTNSQTDGLILVGISVAQETPDDSFVTAVTYGGQSLTKIRHDVATRDARTELWYRIGTLSGAQTVSITTNAANDVVAGAISFTGAHQTSPIGNHNGANNDGGSGTASVSVSSATGEIVVDTVAVETAVTLTVGSGQTQRWNMAEGPGGNTVTGGGSTEPGAASVTMSWSISTSSQGWAISAVSIKPAIPDYDVFFEIWNKATDTVSETIGSCVDVTTYGDDVQCLVSGVGAKTLTSDQVVRIRVRHSANSGTVSIEYDDADSTGNSRVTIPIPEFPEFALSFAFSVLLVVAVRFRRRRNRMPASP